MAATYDYEELDVADDLSREEIAAYLAVSADESLSHETAVALLLRRNERIHQALEDLPDYHVSPSALWPSVLEMVSDLPTLIYRLVRRGDVNALSDLLLSRSQQQHVSGGGAVNIQGNPQKKRSLPPAPPRPRFPRNA